MMPKKKQLKLTTASPRENANPVASPRSHAEEQGAATVELATPEADAPALPFPVVGIGASAGGLDAFKRFFGAMPAESGMAFVLIPHLDPTHESLMVKLLTKYTSMPVIESDDGTPVEPNHVY